jgi:hypothetical protein
MFANEYGEEQLANGNEVSKAGLLQCWLIDTSIK